MLPDNVVSSSKSEDYARAKDAQDFFRDAIDHCMEGKLTELKKHIQKYQEKHAEITLRDIFLGFQSEGKTLVHMAASSGNENVVNYIVENLNPKDVVSVVDQKGFTALINATISESESVITTLLEHGADVNARNTDGASSLHFAAGDGSVSRINLLCKSGAKIDFMSQSGNALHWAAGRGRSDAVKLLIDIAKEGRNGHLDIDMKSPEGLPAVLLAAVSSSDESVKYLVEAGADIGMIVTGNLTALHICAEHNMTEAVRSMVGTATGQRCCNIETVDGNKPIHLAAMSKNRVIIALLLPYTELTADENTLLSNKSVEDIIDYLVEDGAKRLDEWHNKYNNNMSEATATTATHNKNSQEILDEARKTQVPLTEEQQQKAEKLKDIGNGLFKSKKMEEAIKAYSEAIAIDKLNAVYYSNRSACFMAMKQYHLALLDGELCRLLRPDWAKGCYRLAAARLALELYEDAAVAAFEGCKLDESNQDLKELLQTAVKKGREAHQSNKK